MQRTPWDSMPFGQRSFRASERERKKASASADGFVIEGSIKPQALPTFFSSDPAKPTTLIPLIFLICPKADQTAPAAAFTTSVSPAFGLHTSNSPK